MKSEERERFGFCGKHDDCATSPKLGLECAERKMQTEAL
jgi:hypothetical protein